MPTGRIQTRNSRPIPIASYDPYLAHLVDQSFTLLELGVHSGKSLKTFATYFPRALVIGVDIEDQGADFSGFPGGFYFVEDWATGYWTDFPDGGAFAEAAIDGKRIVSHDHGMVGFVKALVDEVMSRGIRPSMTARPTRPNRLETMHVHKAAVVLTKA